MAQSSPVCLGASTEEGVEIETTSTTPVPPLRHLSALRQTPLDDGTVPGRRFSQQPSAADWARAFLVLGAGAGIVYVFRREFPHASLLYVDMVVSYARRCGNAVGASQLETQRAIGSGAVDAATCELLITLAQYDAVARAMLLAFLPTTASRWLGLMRISAKNAVGGLLASLGRRPARGMSALETGTDSPRTSRSERKTAFRAASFSTALFAVSLVGTAFVGYHLVRAAQHWPQLCGARCYRNLLQFARPGVPLQDASPAAVTQLAAAVKPAVEPARAPEKGRGILSGFSSPPPPSTPQAPIPQPLPVAVRDEPTVQRLVLESLPRFPSAYPEVVLFVCFHAPSFLPGVTMLFRSIFSGVREALHPHAPESER